MPRKFTRVNRKGARKTRRQRGGSVNKPWALVQYDNRPIPDHYKKLIEVNKEYCQKYGYEHILKTDPIDLPPWWIKVQICRDLLNSDKYNGVMWLDTDVGIFDCSRSLDEFTKDPKMHFFISKDPFPEEMSIINAGSWIVKNTPLGKEIMNEWFKTYDKTKWIRGDEPNPPLPNKLVIDPKLSFFDKAWAGINFEQGSLYYNFVRNPKYKDAINVLPNKVLSHWEPSKNDGSFTGHFFRYVKNHSKYDNKEHIEIFLKNRVKC